MKRHQTRDSPPSTGRVPEPVEDGRDLVARMAQPHEVMDVVQTILAAGCGEMGASAAILYQCTEDGRGLELLAEHGYPPNATEPWRHLSLDQPLPICEAVNGRKPLFFESFEELVRLYPVMEGAHNTRSAATALLPLLRSEQVLGAIVLSFERSRAFSPLDRGFMGAMAAFAALTLDRARALGKERIARLRASLLARTSHMLAVSPASESPLRELAQIFVPEIAEWCAIDVLEDGEIRRKAVAHVDPEKVKWAEEIHGRYPPAPDAPRGVPNVLRTGQSELYPAVDDALIRQSALDAEHLELLRALEFRSVMIVPITARERTMGAISFVATGVGRRYEADDLAFAEEVGRRVGLALDHARLLRDAETARARLEGILASAMDAIVTIDEEQNIVLFNAAAEAMFGCNSAEALGRPITRFIPEQHRTDHGEHVRRFGRAGTTKRSMGSLGTLAALRANGETFPIEATISKLRDGDRNLYTVILRDVTERAAYQRELEDAARHKDDFLAMLGHELRNPLSALQTAVQVSKIVGPQGDPRAERAREVMERQTSHMSRLIDDLLDVSRVMRGKIELRSEILDLRSVVWAVLGDYADPAKHKCIELLVGRPMDEPIWIRGDEARLVQIVGNLVNNAVKFTDAGGEVVIELQQRGSQVELSVQDTGVGIDAQVLEHIFEPFRQADTSLVRTGGGLGLGLSVVRGLATLHGGDVKVFSEGPGRGARFTLSLPMATPVDAGPQVGPEEHARVAHRILLVEDNPDAATVLSDLLTLAGHEVRLARRADEALESFEAFRPDVVLCDIGLPGSLSGYDVARRLSQRGDLGNLVLIALTGYGRPEDRQRAMDAGFDAHLTKPVSAERIEQAISESRARTPKN